MYLTKTCQRNTRNRNINHSNSNSNATSNNKYFKAKTLAFEDVKLRKNLKKKKSENIRFLCKNSLKNLLYKRATATQHIRRYTNKNNK